MKKSLISILLVLVMVFSSFVGYADEEKIETASFGSMEWAGQPLRVALTVETAGNNIRIISKLDDESEIRQRLISKYLSLGYYGTAILDSVSGTSTSLVADSSLADTTYLKVNGVELGSANGIGVSVTAATHGKKTADLGSVWKDSSGNKWTLVRVENVNVLNFLPEVKTDANGNWTFPATISGKNLTYDADYSGNYAANQNKITFTTQKKIQVEPLLDNRTLDMYAYKNGVCTEYADTDKITANTTFVCDRLVIVEKYDIADLGTLGETIRANRPATGFTSKNLSGGEPIISCEKTITIYDTGNVTEKFEYDIKKDGFNVEFSGYQLSGKKDAFAGGIESYNSGDGRAAQYYINTAGERQMAFVSGYIPEKDDASTEWTFRSYVPLTQGDDDVVVYDIEDNDDVYFYADFMETTENYTINLDEEALLSGAELVDKSDDVTYSINNNILTVSGERGGYICVKAKQKPQIQNVLYDLQTKTLGILVKNKSKEPQNVNIVVAGYEAGALVYADYLENVEIAADGFTKVPVEDFEKGDITDVKAFICEENLTPVNLSKLGNIELYGEENLTYGQETAVKRANQLTGFTFTPVNKIVTATSSTTYGYFMPGETYQGIPYSSCEVNDKFICENVSFETFLSALANPDSVLYTKDIKSASNGSTYYGMVCNGFVRYCLGIDQRCNTQNWLEIPGMTVLAEKSKYTENDLKVADILHAYGDGSNHVAMITDIFRDKNGKIVFIEVSESIRQTCKRRVFSVSEYFSKYVKYRICRYDYLESIPPFDQEQCDMLYSGLDKIQPMIAVDNGDKSNYLEGETVVISSFKDGDNTIEIEKDGEVIETIDVTGYKKLSRKLEAGYYKVRLKDTEFVTEFCVCKYDITFTKESKKVTITAKSDMGEIVHMDFRQGTSAVGGLATNGMITLTEEEKASGIFTRSIPSNAGGFKIYFKNKYGIWSHQKINL